MTESARIHKGDINTEFQFTIKDQDGVVVDLSSSSVKKIEFYKPDGTVLTKDASFVTDGKDGKLKCVTVSTDLSVAGHWEVQAYVEVGSGKWHSNMSSFLVYDVIT